MLIRGTNENEIVEIVKSFKSKRSTDWNDIDMTIIQNIIEYEVKALNRICNQSVHLGIFPKKMKIAKVIPIYKTGNRHELSNYRPVSLLPQFSKILAKIMYSRLNNFITKHNILIINEMC